MGGLETKNKNVCVGGRSPKKCRGGPEKKNKTGGGGVSFGEISRFPYINTYRKIFLEGYNKSEGG